MRLVILKIPYAFRMPLSQCKAMAHAPSASRIDERLCVCTFAAAIPFVTETFTAGPWRAQALNVAYARVVPPKA